MPAGSLSPILVQRLAAAVASQAASVGAGAAVSALPGGAGVAALPADEQSYCPDNETCCQLSSGQYGYFPIRSHAGQSKRISVTDRIIRPGLV
ncbi:unnamed protein product [Rotaria magnacalcarata]